MRKGYLSHRRTANAQASLRVNALGRQSLRCSPKYIEQKEDSDKRPEIGLQWMAAHAYLKDLKSYNDQLHFLVRRPRLI